MVAMHMIPTRRIRIILMSWGKVIGTLPIMIGTLIPLISTGKDSATIMAGFIRPSLIRVPSPIVRHIADRVFHRGVDRVEGHTTAGATRVFHAGALVAAHMVDHKYEPN